MGINQVDIKDHFESCHRVTSWRFLAKNQNKCLKFLYLHYWYAPRVHRGVYRSGRNHRSRISRFQMRPWRFRTTGTQKVLKKCRNLLKMPVFEQFLGSSCFKPLWLHLKPKNLNSMVSPGSVDPLGYPGGVSIAEWKKIGLICLSGQGYGRSKISFHFPEKYLSYIIQKQTSNLICSSLCMNQQIV